MELSPLVSRPDFDLEQFMIFCGEKRLAGDDAERLGESWSSWLPLLEVWSIKNDAGLSCIAIWLPECVEQWVDALWRDRPSAGYRLNSLAQYMCMAAVLDFVPQIEALGCAPTPRPDAVMQAALGQIGFLPGASGHASRRRYALLTPYPFRGGCEICHLLADCPRGQPPAMTLG